MEACGKCGGGISRQQRAHVCRRPLPAFPPTTKTKPKQTPAASKLVFERIDLLDDIAAVPELMQLVAHTCTTRVVLQRWQEGDLSARSRVSYPDGLLQWSRREFLRAKGQQAALLGTGGKAGEAARKAGEAARRAVVGGGGEGGGGPGGAGEGEAAGAAGVSALALAVVPTQPGHLRSRL